MNAAFDPESERGADFTLGEFRIQDRLADEYENQSAAYRSEHHERDYIERTIATIRQHNPNHLRENWWTGAALALANEVERCWAEIERLEQEIADA